MWLISTLCVFGIFFFTGVIGTLIGDYINRRDAKRGG
jgi:hypothetical protein